MESDEKRAFSVEAERALEHPLVIDCIEEQMENLGMGNHGMPKYALFKIAHYAATVARAQALGVDPDELRLTAEESKAEVFRVAAEAVGHGVPVDIYEVDDE